MKFVYITMGIALFFIICAGILALATAIPALYFIVGIMTGIWFSLLLFYMKNPT